MRTKSLDRGFGDPKGAQTLSALHRSGESLCSRVALLGSSKYYIKSVKKIGIISLEREAGSECVIAAFEMTNQEFTSALRTLCATSVPSILRVAALIIKNSRLSDTAEGATRTRIRRVTQRACERAKALPAPDSASIDLLRALASIYNAMLTQAQLFEQPLRRGLPLAVLWDIAEPIERWLLTALAKGLSVSKHLDTGSNENAYVLSVRGIIDRHRAATHRFYQNVLPQECSVEGLAFYLRQESTIDPHFDDLLAHLQIGAPLEAKVEIGENYYDEIGRGNPVEVHSRLFTQCDEAVSSRSKVVHHLLPESILCGNLSTCLALHREYYPIAVGYFGATEDLAPRRFLAFLQAWERCGLPSEEAAYQRIHVEVDVHHADGWWRRVAFTPSQRSSAFKKSVELGILLRLDSSARYLDAMCDAIAPFLG
jgi:hypothetical protein